MQNHQFPSMHNLNSNLQLSGSMDPRNNHWQQRPFPPPLFVVNPGPFVLMPQLPGPVITPWPGCHWQGFYSLPSVAGPVNQGMVQQLQFPSRAPSWGPSRHQRRMGSHRAEPQPFNLTHQSSGTIARDRSTGTHPGMARMGTNNNSGAEKVWRTPSRNPCNLDG
jgi:hypothetical protein